MPALKLALRTLFRTPFITAIAVLSLALGIGANAAIYSLFDQMLLRPLPVSEPDRLVNLAAPGPKHGALSCNLAGDCDAVFSYPMFRDLQREVGSFAGLAAHRPIGANLAQRNRTRSGQGVLVSGSYFPLLGVRPAVGRLLGPEDDRTVGAHPVAVLSHRYWQRELGGDPAVLDETVVVNGHPFTIVGVAGPGFDGTTLGHRPDVFVPLTMRGAVEATFDDFDDRRNYWAYVFGRLGPGVSIDRARTDVNGVYRNLVVEVEAPLQQGMSEQTMERFRTKEVAVSPGARGQSGLHSEVETPLRLLFAITGVVLLIACANIANLLLARGAGRHQEMAVRASLGAGRGRLVGQLLTESVLLAALGGVASLLVARWTLAVVAASLPAEAAAGLDLEMSANVVVFTAAVAIGTGLLFGLYPALHSTRTDLVAGLKSTAGQPSGSRSAARFRTGLVTAQIALSMALLVAAGLFIRSLVNVGNVDLGLSTEDVVTFRVSPQLSGYEPERSAELFGRLEEELAAVPGVSEVSGGLIPLIANSNSANDVSVEGFEGGPDVDSNARWNAISPGYFRTLRIPLLAGRDFTTSDTEGGPEVAIVNEAFTEKFGLGGRDAVGRWMAIGRTDELDIRIVGVVADAKYSEVKQDPPPQYFRPWRQRMMFGTLTFYLRTALEPDEVMRAVPPLVARLDPNLPVEELKTLERQVRENVFLDRVIGGLSAAFAVLATLLAAIGLYGVLAYTVAQRTREIGLRMALGARSGDVRRMVLRQVLGMTVVGGLLGIVAAFFVGRAAESLLFGLDGHDPAVVASVCVLLGLVAVGAGLVPALRASRVDPMRALRWE